MLLISNYRAGSAARDVRFVRPAMAAQYICTRCDGRSHAIADCIPPRDTRTGSAARSPHLVSSGIGPPHHQHPSRLTRPSHPPHRALRSPASLPGCVRLASAHRSRRSRRLPRSACEGCAIHIYIFTQGDCCSPPSSATPCDSHVSVSPRASRTVLPAHTSQSLPPASASWPQIATTSPSPSPTNPRHLRSSPFAHPTIPEHSPDYPLVRGVRIGWHTPSLPALVTVRTPYHSGTLASRPSSARRSKWLAHTSPPSPPIGADYAIAGATRAERLFLS